MMEPSPAHKGRGEGLASMAQHVVTAVMHGCAKHGPKQGGGCSTVGPASNRIIRRASGSGSGNGSGSSRVALTVVYKMIVCIVRKRTPTETPFGKRPH
jgi:hypothetical protein